jgi:hypothetical protein
LSGSGRDTCECWGLVGHAVLKIIFAILINFCRKILSIRKLHVGRRKYREHATEVHPTRKFTEGGKCTKGRTHSSKNKATRIKHGNKRITRK